MSPTWATEHFTKSELSCQHCGKMEFPPTFLTHLEELRTQWDRPIHLNSAFRCPLHPEEAKKLAPGEHTRGAVDIACSGPDQYFLLQLSMKLGWSGIGVGRGFLHIDRGLPRPSAGRPAIWTYS